MPAALRAPRYISFDCYGTLIDFRIGATTRDLLAGHVTAERISAFLADFAAYRFDEVQGPWKPYADVLHNALRRTCRCWSLPFATGDAEAIVAAVPTWGPHADVPMALARLAQHFPLVILSNAADAQIQANVARLRAPFHAVLTAEQAGAYKPRFQPFEYMFDRLGCDPSEILHVSSSLRYDLMTAHDLHIGQRVYVDRGHDHPNPVYGYRAIPDLGALPGWLGL